MNVRYLYLILLPSLCYAPTRCSIATTPQLPAIPYNIINTSQTTQNTSDVNTLNMLLNFMLFQHLQRSLQPHQATATSAHPFHQSTPLHLHTTPSPVHQSITSLAQSIKSHPSSVPSSPLDHTTASNSAPSAVSQESFIAQLAALSIRPSHVGIGASFLGALLAWLKVKILTQTALHRGRWATWRSDIPVQILMELTEEEIVAQLWPAIRDYYAREEVPLDVFATLKMFLDDIHQERICLNDLIWWYNLVRTLRLSALLGNDEHEKRAQQYAQRLNVLEECVHLWANTCLCKDGIAKKLWNM